MNGIQGLMPQGQPQAQPQMPGQAPMPGQAMMPGMQPGAGGPPPGITSDRIPDLAKLNEQMLVQLFNLSMTNQIQKPSPISILSAISEKQKQKQAQAAVAGAVAQGQNAQNQQSGTVAQEIIGPLMQQRAAQGGVMHGYAGGGIVAFQSGTAERGLPFPATPSRTGLTEEETAKWMSYAPLEEKPTIDQREVDRILKKAPMTRTPAENDLLRAAGVSLTTRTPAPEGSLLQRAEDFVKSPFIREAITGEAHTLSSEELAKRTDVGAITERGFRALGGSQAEAAPSRSPTAFIPVEDARRRSDIPPGGIVVAEPSRRAPPPEAKDKPRVRPPAPAPAPVAAAPAPAPTTTPFSGIAALTAKPDPELEAAFRRREAAAGVSAADLADLKAKQAAEIAARTAAETGRSQRAEEARTRATQAYQEALTGQEGIFGPRGLFEIAAAIDPRRGQIMGSLARGATGVLAREEKAKKEARTEYERAQQLYAQELNALDALRVATKERDTAITSGNIEAARAAEDRRAQIQIDYNKLKEERTQAQRNLALEVAKAEQTAAYQKTVGEAAIRQARAAETTAGKPAGEIQVMEYLKKPENFALKEKIESAKRAEDRMVRLQEIFSKMTELDRLNMGVKNFDDFLKAVTPTKATATGPAAGADFVFNPATGKLEPKK